METGFLRPLRKFGDWMQIGDNPFCVLSEFRLITSVRLLLTSVCPGTNFCICIVLTSLSKFRHVSKEWSGFLGQRASPAVHPPVW